VLKQDLDFWHFADLVMQYIKINVFLKDGAHPFEGGLPRSRRKSQLPPQRRYRPLNRT
jgi:hypothetical protein